MTHRRRLTAAPGDLAADVTDYMLMMAFSQAWRTPLARLRRPIHSLRRRLATMATCCRRRDDGHPPPSRQPSPRHTVRRRRRERAGAKYGARAKLRVRGAALRCATRLFAHSSCAVIAPRVVIVLLSRRVWVRSTTLRSETPKSSSTPPQATSTLYYIYIYIYNMA